MIFEKEEHIFFLVFGLVIFYSIYIFFDLILNYSLYNILRGFGISIIILILSYICGYLFFKFLEIGEKNGS